MIDLPRRTIAIIVQIVIVVALGWLALHWFTKGQQAAGEARVAQEGGKAASDSAKDAIAVQGASQGRERAIDEITKENDRAIHAAKGADAPVDPAADAAGRASLCRRATYRGHPDCVQFTPAR